MDETKKTAFSLSVRPYQLMCLICWLGEAETVRRLKDPALNLIFQDIRKNPRIPLKLVDYDGDALDGCSADSPCGVLFHMFQDESVKSRFKAFSGKWERARTGLGKLFDTSKHVPGTEGFCWFEPKAPPAWRGCPRAGNGDYERGRKRLRLLATDILPAFNSAKTQPELDAIKAKTAGAVLDSEVIRLFPNHLLFVASSYLQCERFKDTPVMHDNLWEPAEAIRRNPNILVMLVPDHCMVCPPCHAYDMAGSGLCQINPLHMKGAEKVLAMNALVTLSTLRTLGLEYYQKVPAHQILKLAKERLTPDHIAFTYPGAPPGYHMFERAMHDGMGFLEAFENPQSVLRRVSSLLSDRRVSSLLPEAERKHVAHTLSQARRHLKQGQRHDAYMGLTESAFTHTWKQYMELIPLGYARLPKTVRTQSDASADRILKATIIPRHVSTRENTSPSIYSSGFVTMVNVNRPAIAETGLAVRYDKHRLLIDLICADPDMGQVKAEAHVGTDLRMVGRRYDRGVEDAVRFIVQPRADLGDIFHFVANSKGVKLGEHVFVRDGCSKTEWIDETCWTVVPYRTRTCWRVEMEIPLSVFGSRTVCDATWRMNAHRYFRNSLIDHHSWNPTTAWNVDDPGQCGRMVFA